MREALCTAQPSFGVFSMSDFIAPERPIFFAGTVLIEHERETALNLAKKELETFQEDRHVFWTDGSVLRSGAAGVGVYWKEHQWGEPWSWMAKGCTIDIAISSNDAEMVAIIEGLRQALLLVERHTSKKPSTIIYTDSKSALEFLLAFPSFKNTGTNGLLYEIIKLTNLLALKSVEVVFNWVPGHKGVLGNELADTLAGVMSSRAILGKRRRTT